MEVRGYADSKLRDPKHPNSPINRRVSILVNMVSPPGADQEAKSEAVSPPLKRPFSLGIQPLE